MLNYSLLHCHNLSLVRLLLFLLVSSTLVPALYVVESSNCTAVCNGPLIDSGTTVDDVSCHDNEYNTTGAGTSFQSCVSCELHSNAVDAKTQQTDLGWALFNMRLTLDQCLYNETRPNSMAPAAQCVSPCSAIRGQLEFNLDKANESTAYEYCAGPTFRQDAEDCAKCYKLIHNQIYLSNFLNTLATACEPISSTFPVASSEIFTTDPPSSLSSAESGGGLSHNSKVAIAIAVPVVCFVFLSIGLITWFVHRSTRRPRRRPRRYQDPPRISKPISSTETSSSPENLRYAQQKAPRQQSRNTSEESRHARLSSTLSRYTPERIPLPRPMRAQKSSVALHPSEKVSMQEMHPANSDQSGFTKRVEVPVPNSTPRENISEDGEYDSTALKVKELRPSALSNLSNASSLVVIGSIDQSAQAKTARLIPRSNDSRMVRLPKLTYRNAAPTSAYSAQKGIRFAPAEESSTRSGLRVPVQPTQSRLLTGSPFDAQSLATLATVTEAETVSRPATSASSRTPRHTPSHSSSKKQRSSSSRTAAPTPTPSQTKFPREQVNDPALARAIPLTPPIEDTGFPSAMLVQETVRESSLLQKEKVNDPALSRALAPSPIDIVKHAIPSPSPTPPGALHERVNDPALARAVQPSTASVKARELSFPAQKKLSVPLIVHEQTGDPQIGQSMPRSPALRPMAPLPPPSPSQERSYTPEPKMHADTGLPSYHDLAWQIAQAQAKASMTNLRGASIGPKATMVSRQQDSKNVTGDDSSRSRASKTRLTTSTKQKGSSKTGPSLSPQTVFDDARSISPGTVPGAAPFGPVSEEPKRRPTSPVSPGTILPQQHSPEYLDTDAHFESHRPLRPHGRPSTPISPGTVPTKNLQDTGTVEGTSPGADSRPPKSELEQHPAADFQNPGAPKRRPTSPVSPRTVPASSQAHQQSRPDPPPRRPTSPISPGTVPADDHQPAQELYDIPQHQQSPRSPRPHSEISPKTLPSARFEAPSRTHYRVHSSDSPASWFSTSFSSGGTSGSVASSGFIPLQRQESRGALIASGGMPIRGAGVVRPSRGMEHGGRPFEERGGAQNVGVRWKGREATTEGTQQAQLRRTELRNSRGKRLGEEMFKSSRFSALRKSS